MEYERIKQLMDDMGNSKLTAIEIDFPDGTKISMKKEATQKIIQSVVTQEEQAQNVEVQEKVEKNTENSVSSNLNIVKSPIVGTFYAKPSPNAENYVEIGKKVKKGDTLCIVEAMKLMNEIESEFDGEIAEIYVKNGEPVEYGAPLFGIK